MLKMFFSLSLPCAAFVGTANIKAVSQRYEQEGGNLQIGSYSQNPNHISHQVLHAYYMLRPFKSICLIALISCE